MKNSEEKASFYDFDEFRLDVSERVLYKNGVPVNVAPKVFETLLALIEKSGHLIGRDELINKVWKDTFVEEANLSVNISVLRKILGRNALGNDFIETVARRGYRFRAEVRQSLDDFPGAEGETLIIERRLPGQIGKTETGINHRAESLKSSAVTNLPIRSLAVLPFQLVKVKKGDEYLSLSLADALITQLGNTSRILVCPTSAIKQFAGQSAVAAGRVLRADAVLECSLYRVENKLRVTALMLETENERSFWSDKFDIEFKDIFVVQDAIAERVTRALTLKLNEQERELLTKRYTISNEAFREYLKGRYYWNKRDVENFYKAIEHFKKAIDLDPTYALAYSGLADTYNMLPMWGEMSPQEGYLLAKAAVLRALEIDDQIADAHASLGYTKYTFDWDWENSEKSYRRAIELNPGCCVARSWYAKLFVSLKRFYEAREQIQVAYTIDPLSPMVSASVIAVYLYARRYDEAIERYKKLLTGTPGFIPALIGLGTAYMQTGMAAEAIAAHQSALKHSGENPILAGVAAATRAKFGEQANALKTIRELKRVYSQLAFLSYVIATIYAQLEKADEAFEWLEKAYRDRVSHLADLLIDPEFDNLRSDSRFDDLLRRMNLFHLK